MEPAQVEKRKRRPNGSVSRQEQKREAARRHRLKEAQEARKRGVRFYRVPMSPDEFEQVLRVVERYERDRRDDAVKSSLPEDADEEEAWKRREAAGDDYGYKPLPTRLPRRKNRLSQYDHIRYLLVNLVEIVKHFEELENSEEEPINLWGFINDFMWQRWRQFSDVEERLLQELMEYAQGYDN